MIQKAGMYFVPLALTLAGIMMLCGDKEIFSEFIHGAENGLGICIDMIPSFVLLITAVEMFTASGAMDVLCGIISVLTEKMHFPTELVPLVLVRPVSGSAANAVANDLFIRYGADSFSGRCASVIMGASDTIIYTLAMYFGAAGISGTRHAYPASFLTMIFCVVFSAFVTKLFF